MLWSLFANLFLDIFFSISSPTFWSFLYVYCAPDYRNINGRWVRTHNEMFREVMTRERLWAGDCSWWCPGYCARPAQSLVHGVNGALITRGPRCHHPATYGEGHCILGQCSPLILVLPNVDKIFSPHSHCCCLLSCKNAYYIFCKYFPCVWVFAL